ncbi:MAG: hypothetical protein GY937_27880 [bacterium]|nr:hypothetical protein [bacterium]
MLTLPYPLRDRYAYDTKLTSVVLRAFVRSLFAELRRRARRQWSLPTEQCSAGTFIQCFGSALDPNVHFHTLAVDGVYPYAMGRRHPAHVIPLPPPEPDEVARVLAGAARRIQCLVEARDTNDADALARVERLLALRRKTTGATEPPRHPDGARVPAPVGRITEIHPAPARRHGGPVGDHEKP